MELDPALAGFRTELEELGYVVVPHGDHICVRLPLLASVRIRLSEGALRTEPLFGPFRRVRALPLGMMGVLAVVAGLFYGVGVGPLTLSVAVGGILLVASDVCRLVLTESCVTRVQLLWASRAMARVRERVFAVAGSAGKLSSGAPNESAHTSLRPASGVARLTGSEPRS